MRILIYNTKHSNNNFHLIISILSAFSSIPGVAARIAENYSIGLLLKSFQPNIVIAFGGEEVPTQLVKSLKQSNTTWILWTTEDPFELDRNKITSRYFDIVLTSDKASQSHYRHPHCYHLPLAADRQRFYRPVIEDVNQLMYDITFVGTAWPNRTYFLAELLQLVSKYALRSRFILPANLSIPPATLQALEMRKFKRDFRISPEDLATLQNRSAFAITLFRDFSADGKARPQSSPSNRFYETALMGTGQIVVCNEFKIKDIYPEIADSIFQHSKAKDIIEIVLDAKHKSGVLRNRAAKQAQSFIVENHLYKHRVQEILNISQRVLA